MSSTPIVRLFHATPRPGAELELAHKLSTESVELVLAQPGLTACLAAGAPPGMTDLLFLTIWQDAASLARFTGPDPNVSILPSGYAELLTAHHVTHRDLLAHHFTEIRWRDRPGRRGTSQVRY